jgi:hypothetical protein
MSLFNQFLHKTGELRGDSGLTDDTADGNEANRVRLDTRLSGQLRRYHTWPVIGQQTVAEHCWQIMRIYLSITDKIDPHMIQYITFHDIGETTIGDLPYPVKSENHDLKKQLDYLEDKSRYLQMGYWGAFRQTFLSDEDKILFKQIELIEMAEFGMDQMCMGNDYAFIVANRCLRKVYQSEACAPLVVYVIRRIKLFYEQYRNSLNSFNEWWMVAKWNEKITHGFNLEEPHGSE